MREHDIEKINNKYLEISRTLQEAGAKAIVIWQTPRTWFSILCNQK